MVKYPGIANLLSGRLNTRRIKALAVTLALSTNGPFNQRPFQPTALSTNIGQFQGLSITLQHLSAEAGMLRPTQTGIFGKQGL